ncbi:MAG TPA: HTTM domain-containing protein [Polyangiaceae bacterium]
MAAEAWASARGDTYLLGSVRVGFGLLFLNEAWLATEHFRGAGYFGHYFHQPFVPEALVPSETAYQVVLATQWIAAALVVAGRWARPSLLVSAGLLVASMLWDRLWFHHYRHTMAAFATLLAFASCDRHFVLGREGDETPGPMWARTAILAQISVMYVASGGSKLLDPGWRGGAMMRGMVRSVGSLLQARGFPASLVDAMQSPLGAGLLAKGAIATELGLAFCLWWSPARRLAVWVGLAFHVLISQLTPVRLFTLEMLLVYLLWATPDVAARVVRYDPERHSLVRLLPSLDWLRRYRLVPENGAALTVVDRGGEAKHGLPAVAVVCGTLPLLFPLWPLVAAAAAVIPGSPRGGPAAARRATRSTASPASSSPGDARGGSGSPPRRGPGPG